MVGASNANPRQFGTYHVLLHLLCYLRRELALGDGVRASVRPPGHDLARVSFSVTIELQQRRQRLVSSQIVHELELLT